MNEPMQVWCRLYGPEKFEGELDYLMAARKAQPLASTSRAPRGSQPPALAKSPALLWRAARHLPDAYLVQGSCVLNWSGTQVQWIAIEGQALPLKDRPLVVLEPTLASVPQRLRRDPRSRAALEAMWDELDAEMEPLRLKFSLGQRSFELLSRIEQRFSSQAQYHLDDTNGSQATLQPNQRQLRINPQARSEQVIQATWRRRPASAQPSEIFEPWACRKCSMCIANAARAGSMAIACVAHASVCVRQLMCDCLNSTIRC
ncbi:MAG: hypothetical protein HC858_11210 [Brachymonas sp.]|nr:hypothetical protein [Brachymonas sp.]